MKTTLLTFVEPRSHPLAAKLDVLDLAKGGEDLLEMFSVDVPGEAANMDLGGRRTAAPASLARRS